MPRVSWALLLLVSALPLQAKGADSAACEAMLGSWNVTSGWPGRFIAAREGTKYLFVYFRSDPSRKSSAPSTDVEKAEAYSTASAGAWESTCDGSRLNMRPLFALNPADIGKEYPADFEVQGDTFRSSAPSSRAPSSKRPRPFPMAGP